MLLGLALSCLSAHCRDSVTSTNVLWGGSPDSPGGVNLLPCSDFLYVAQISFLLLIPSFSPDHWPVRVFPVFCSLVASLDHTVPSIHPHLCLWFFYIKSVCSPHLLYLLPSSQVPLMVSKPKRRDSRAGSHRVTCNVQFQLNTNVHSV